MGIHGANRIEGRTSHRPRHEDHDMNAASYVALEQNASSYLRWIAVGIASAIASMVFAVTLLGAVLWAY